EAHLGLKFISWCEEQCQIKRDHPTEKFCTFLEKSNCTVAKLREYSHNWADAMIGEYLMSLVSFDHSQMRSKLRDSGLTWPFHENSVHIYDNMPSLLQKILDWDKSKNCREQNISDFFSYVIVLGISTSIIRICLRSSR
uniref:Uncharacterized protein n=1 Tax=Setaria italica TaxID=4555 RepID=K3ZCP7_SETIT